MTCKTSSRSTRGMIGAGVGLAVGLGISFIMNQFDNWFGVSMDFNDKPMLKNLRVYGLPVVGAASGAYVVARKPQCFAARY